MRVLITGGAGFIGSHSTAALLSAGVHVRVFDNFSTGKQGNLALFPDAEVITGDILDEPALAKAMEGMDAVLHLAAVVSVPISIERPRFAHAINSTGTLNVMEAARTAGVRRVVYASSAAVYGIPSVLPINETLPLRPLSPYGSHKRYNEETAQLAYQLYGLETVGLRYFNVYGPRQDPASPYTGVLSIFIDRLLKDQAPTIHGDGLQTRDFVSVLDVAQANLLALTSSAGSGMVFNVGTGQALTILEAYHKIARSIGTQRDPSFGAERAGDIRQSCAEIRSIKELLGWQSKVSFTDGISQTIDWCRQAPAVP